MTKAQAINEVMKQTEKDGVILSSREIVAKATELIEKNNEVIRHANEYNSLAGARVKTRMSGALSPIQVVQVLNSSTCAEFVGEEFWMGLNSVSERVVAVRVYNMIRAKLTTRMG